MAERREPVADEAGADRFNLTLQRTLEKFHSNVTRLLTVESNTERERTQSREALVHAGKMAAVGRMVASVNHEIKRPLASMRLLVETARDMIDAGDKESALENMDMLLRAVSQLTELSRQLEGFSRNTPLNITEVALQCAVLHARLLLTPKIRTGQHELRASVGTHLVRADLDRLKLALVNIIDNAMDACAFSPDRRIDVDAAEEGDEIALRVRDHGPGIAPEAMERMFDAFYTTKPEGQGLGLGLALSSQVIAEMGGRLSARNHPDGGAEFTIHLPVIRRCA